MDLRYPVGRFDRPYTFSDQDRAGWIETLAEAPGKLREAVAGLSDAQLDTPYRPEGWTARQVVHHVADSHMNSFIRFRLALTEDRPTIKPYDEAKWALLPDSGLPVEVSLQLVESLHHRMVVMLKAMTADQFQRSFVHPERGPMDLNTNLALYAWHSRHHIAHITELRARMGWK